MHDAVRARGLAAHTARLRPARGELLLANAVFAELGRLGAVGATVPSGGRAGAGGQVGRVVLSRLEGAELVESELSWAREELAFAVAAPVWDRFGSFAGQPRITGREPHTRLFSSTPRFWSCDGQSLSMIRSTHSTNPSSHTRLVDAIWNARAVTAEAPWCLSGPPPDAAALVALVATTELPGLLSRQSCSRLSAATLVSDQREARAR